MYIKQNFHTKYTSDPKGIYDLTLDSESNTSKPDIDELLLDQSASHRKLLAEIDEVAKLYSNLLTDVNIIKHRNSNSKDLDNQLTEKAK